MRIPIREQLAILILLSSLVGLGVISIATWVSNHDFVTSIVKSRLSVRSSLKAAQLASNLNLMQTTATYISTRIIIQDALEEYNVDANESYANWQSAAEDMEAALSSPAGLPLLLQTVVYPKDADGPAGSKGLLNTTSSAVMNDIRLPYVCPDGTRAALGTNYTDCGGLSYGYPPNLYPNLTYTTSTLDDTEVQQAIYNGVAIGPGAKSGLLLGPWAVNDSFSLVSITMPVLNNTSPIDVLGWLTAVMDARLISQVLDSTEGLDRTGVTLLVGPANSTNVFPRGTSFSKHLDNDNHPGDLSVQYVAPLNTSWASRHPGRTVGSPNAPFNARKYPAVDEALHPRAGDGSLIQGRNEADKEVATGYAMLTSDLVDWLVLVEQSRNEVWAPIHHLRDILLACVFGTLGLMIIITYPLAHFASLPIRRLREATAKSVEPPGLSPSRSSIGSSTSEPEGHVDGSRDLEGAEEAALARKEGAKEIVSESQKRRPQDREFRRDTRRKRAFRIPSKVKERKNFLKDELSDLTKTFNEMSDELMMQYARLEERVQQRTAELEESKRAAEAANESKTLFIANISHELKTPLNAILGMAAVCMQEDDQVRLRRSLGIIYKSGDLLLNLLTDLLTFSKNQVGQHLNLDEKEFRLRDVSSQTLAIFDKQASEGHIGLRVEWEGIPYYQGDDAPPETTDYGPNGTGRMKDMILWGDLQRILQVVINLVSNSLKFTPSGGTVTLTIRCLSEPCESLSRIGSSASRHSRQSRQSRVTSSRGGRGSDSASKIDTANAINARDRPSALASLHGQERASTPPPGTYIYFEFEVNDTGPGIPENLQHKIFEPFVQGDLSLNKKYGGTGLGLSICAQLSSLMRGTMSLRSTQGNGSTFTLKIPLRHLKTRADSSASSLVEPMGKPDLHKIPSLEDGEWTPARHSRALAEESPEDKASINAPPSTASVAKDSQPRLVGLSQPFFASSQPMESPSSQPAAMEKMAREVSRSGERIRVLVAEDNKINQEVVLRMLKLEDIYDVTVAKDGQEALDFVKATMDPANAGEYQPFNLIFMDVQMPNVDGLQSTRLIREMGYRAPIVALTAFAEESNIKDCLDSGMDYFLSKPIRRPQLKKVLSEYCAPIPEENEESTLPETLPLPKTTVMVVNKSSADQPKDETGWPQPESTRVTEETNRPVSPVSPLTNP